MKRQFLATANFSPEIYSPNCIFTDEIDSYGYADFVKVPPLLLLVVVVVLLLVLGEEAG